MKLFYILSYIRNNKRDVLVQFVKFVKFSSAHVYFEDFNINLLKYFIKMKWIPGISM